MFRSQRRRSASRISCTAPAISVEHLENRQLLAAFGNAWADPRSISISFPSENTPIGSAQNRLRTTLDAVAPRLEWQTAILRAAQTWAENANINIGLVPDRGDNFGAVGLASNDPRFGEIRVGAFPQSRVVANAVANLPISGTWGGDILLDSTERWAVSNSNSQQANTGNNASSRCWYRRPVHHCSPRDWPFAVPRRSLRDRSRHVSDLHRAAAVTSLPPISPQFRQSTVLDRILSKPRQTIPAAQQPALTFSNSAAAAKRLQVPGSLKDSSDVDVYSFQTLPGHSSATITLWAAGISLLDAEVEVRGTRGGRIDLQRAESIFRNNVRISLSQLTAGETYFVSVRKNNNTAFSVGDYQLDLDFRSGGQLASVIPAPHDADPYMVKRRLANTESAAILQGLSSALIDPETTSNETPTTATALDSGFGFAAGTHYEAIGSLASASDRDFYTIKAPAVVGGVLNVDLAPLGTTPVNAELYVMNAAGDRLAARMIRNADGTVQVQVQQPVASETYLIGVRTAPGAIVTTGNYALTADFSTASATMSTVLQSSVAVGQQRAVMLTSNKSQLFRIDLAAAAGSSQQGAAAQSDQRRHW
ncbi:MAG UNVERIFIED_CONTAM: hypothetical protein LVR18_28725 [Planctomycetaceae bacterium]